MLLNQKKEIQEVLEKILGAPLDFKILPHPDEEKLKENFSRIISNFEFVWKRQLELEKYEIDLSTYDDKFFRLAEDLIHFCFDPEAAEAVMFYIYARITDSGEIQSFTDPEGNHHKFESIDDLWEYMLVVAEKNMDDEI
jgi:ABC-type uncharacterized transport system substrate-binding protein